MDYVITVKGHISLRTAKALPGFKVANLPCGEASICGYIEDQAALHATISRIRDLALEIISINRRRDV